MPFEETCALEERIALAREWKTGAFSITELWRRFDICRDTFYFWRARWESGDERWFEDRSHAVVQCPHATASRLEKRIIATRERFPHFGPKKIKAWLEREQPNERWPAHSTIGDILKRAGLVAAKRRRCAGLAQGEIVTPATAPNEEWSIDFKGWFRTLDGRRCDPLTITDAASRYLIEVRIVDPTWAGVRSALEQVFSELGLPDAIRSDNGAPFGSTGAGGLSALAVWWLKLDIEPRYIPPSSPQDNGRHERMHRTLKAETSKPAAASMSEQQARFDRFRVHYNNERPHEAIGQMTPASLWLPPSRKLPAQYTIPGATRIMRSAACATPARSNGGTNSSSSARRWPAS
jgi:transposase InsO family protein